MITLKKRPLGSYAPNIQTGSMIYAYESTHQDATRTHQPTPDQLRRLWEEEQRRQESARIHAEPARQVAIAAAAGATGGAAGGLKGAIAGGTIAAIASATAHCQNCHK